MKHQIDKHDPDLRQKVEFNSQNTLDEIAYEIDCLSLFTKKFVLSHIILPEDLYKYIEIFEERHMLYKFILLSPPIESSITRCKTRTCHKTITPDYYAEFYHNKLDFTKYGTDCVHIIDNTNLSVTETTKLVHFI